MKNRSNTHTYLSDRAIDPIYVKLSFDTIYVIIGMLSSSIGFESLHYFGLRVCTVPQNQASKSILLSFKPIWIESIYNQLSADTLFVIFGPLYHVHRGRKLLKINLNSKKIILARALLHTVASILDHRWPTPTAKKSIVYHFRRLGVLLEPLWKISNFFVWVKYWLNFVKY